MSDILNILMEDPAVKEEIVLRAKQAVRNITFTKQDMTEIKAAVVNMVVKQCTTLEDDDFYYDIQYIIKGVTKKLVTDRFSDLIDK